MGMPSGPILPEVPDQKHGLSELAGTVMDMAAGRHADKETVGRHVAPYALTRLAA